MPFYEFICEDCKIQYEELCPYEKKEKYKKVKCPECGSKNKTKIMSQCAFRFAQPEGTDRWTSDRSGHDYRFKYNVPKVQKERALAEVMSHMGANPYGDTSAKDIAMDTGVHDAESRSGLS